MHYKYFIKEFLKNLAHSIKIVPYRKPSKRYKIWKKRFEKKLIERIKKFYAINSKLYDSIDISIVMPAHNRAHCIEKAIQSVLNQTHINWQLIIVDDGSTDGLEEYVRKFSRDKRVQNIKKQWGGVSQARNYGLDNAKGKYIFYLDTDNAWYPDYLRNMIVFMEKGNLDACYSGTRIIDDDGKVIGYYGENFIWNECWELNYIDINCFAHRQDLLEKGFRFDETLTRLVDWDFILAITALHRTAYAPFLGVEYYDGSQGNRITFTQHLGDEISNVIKVIHSKHKKFLHDPAIKSKQLRPNWKDILV